MVMEGADPILTATAKSMKKDLGEMDKEENVWYIGFITDLCEESEDSVLVDHLHPIHRSLSKWRYPTQPDQCKVDTNQVLLLRPKFEWDLSGRNSTLTLTNHSQIVAEVLKFKLK